MKTKVSIVFLLFVFASLVRAQAGASAIILLQGPGGTFSARVDPSGNATIDNVKPGTYKTALLVPAVQKLAAAGGSTNAPGRPGEIQIESYSWGMSNAAYDH